MPGPCVVTPQVVTAKPSGIRSWLRICIAIGVTLLSASGRADDRAAAEKMLAEYEQTVGQLASFHIECVTRQWDSEALKEPPEKIANAVRLEEESAIFHDDFRWRIAMVKRLRQRESDRFQSAPLAGVEFRFDEIRGVRQGLHVQWASRDAAEPPKFDHLSVFLFGEELGDHHGTYFEWPAVGFGILPCDAQNSIWKLMRDATTLELLPEEKIIDQHKTRALRSKGPFGTHTIYLDPEFGCLPRRIEIRKENGQLWNEVQMGVEQDPSAKLPANLRAAFKAQGKLQPPYTVTEFETLVDNIQLEKRDGRFVMTAFDNMQKHTLKTEDRVEEKRDRTEYRTRIVDLQPTNWPATAFTNSIPVPNGTKVRTPKPGESYVWKDGKVE